jgi:mannosyltransferase OCH1-like enzyme
LWLQGLDHAPSLVRASLQRWAALNPECELRVFDQTTLGDALASFSTSLKNLSPQAVSDLVRARILLSRGGVWADATVFPVRPLRDWLRSSWGNPAFSRSRNRPPIARCRHGLSRRRRVIC